MLYGKTLTNFRFLFFFLQGYTPLHLALQFGRNEVINLLLNVYSKYLSIYIYIIIVENCNIALSSSHTYGYRRDYESITDFPPLKGA